MIEQGRWSEAGKLWSDSAAAAQFSDGLKGYPEVHLEIGELGRMEGAVSWLSRSVDDNPRGVFNRLFFASALAMAGRSDEARIQMAEFQRLRPGFTLGQFRAREPSDTEPFRRQRELVYQGLRVAGIPE